MPSSISTVREVGVPSSSMVSEPRRPGDRAVVDHGHAGRGDALAQQAGEGRRLLAIEIAFQPVADRLMQQNAGPARAQHHRHLAGRRGDGFEIDQRLAQRLVDRACQ
jgi:hypothetical protein